MVAMLRTNPKHVFVLKLIKASDQSSENTLMTDKRLVVVDVDQGSSEFGSLEAIDPGSATALPIPAFRMGTAMPPAGTIMGEGFINTTANTAAVWDGSTWIPVVPGALVVYATDADVIADANQSTGTYATSQASGNLFVKSNIGWRQIGIRTYTDSAALLADASAPEGSLGVSIAEKTFWIMHSNAWHCLSKRPFPDASIIE